MFGVSVKVWRMEDEEEEFSLILTHISSIKKFLLLYLDTLETDFLVNKPTVTAISAVSKTQITCDMISVSLV